MIKKIFIGSGIAFGVVAVVAGTVSCDVAKNNTGNEIKPEEKPNVPDVHPEEKPNVPDVQPEEKPNVPDVQPEEKPNVEQEKEKTDFIQALKSSSFTKPIKFELPITIKLPTNTTQETIDNVTIKKEIIESLSYCWSSSGKAPNINISNKGGDEYIVSLDKNKNNQWIDKYVESLFGKTWSTIMNESNNKDFQNINQVDYEFKLVISQNKSSAQLVPTSIQVFFAKQPSWLKENNFRVSLLENKELISTLNLTFKS